jgi:UDP-N-acetylmuramoyl-L-alanyl-D-glutamate--2,6-diaminopimelate ligase
MEVSSHALDLKRVDANRFAAAVFTNLSQDHLDYHRDMEAYFAAKSRLFRELLAGNGHAGLAVLNADDPYGQRLRHLCSTPVLTYGLEQGADIRPERYTLAHDGIRAKVATPCGTWEITSPLLGHYNLVNILAAVATALGLGVAPEHIITGLATLTGVDGRLEPVMVPGQPLVLVDYAHTPDALQQVLQALRSLPFQRIITVFGCGGDRDRSKRPLMGQAAAQGSDLVIVTSDNPRTENPLAIIEQIEDGLRELGWPYLNESELATAARGYLVMPDRRQAIRTAVDLARPGEVILLAGKGHETYQIIGTERYHFDDREEARLALQQRARRQAGEAGLNQSLAEGSET